MSSSNVGEVFVRCIPLVTGVHYTLIRVLWSKASFSVLWIARASMGIRSGWRGGGRKSIARTTACARDSLVYAPDGKRFNLY